MFGQIDFNAIPQEKVVTFPDNGVVFLKGAPGDHAFIVKKGRVEIRDAGRALESIDPGEIFGEMALIDEGPRSASAVAVEPSEVIVLDRDTFNGLVRDHPDFALFVMRLMVRRLRTMNALQPVVEDLPVPPRPLRSA